MTPPRPPRRPAAVAAVLFIAVSAAAAADTAAAPLALADLEHLARAHNPTLAQAAAQLDAARARAVQAGLHPNPTVGYYGQQIGNEGTAGQQGGFVTQTVVTGGKLRLNRAKFTREADAVCWQAHVQEVRVLNTVRFRFWQVVALRYAAGAQDDLVRRADDAIRAVEDRHKAGQADRADVLEANQEKKQLEDLRGEIATRHESAWRRLAALVGLPDLPAAPLPADLEAPPAGLDYAAALAEVLAASPELGVARAQAEREQVSLRRELVEPIPNVQLQAATAYNFSDHRQNAYAQVGVMLPVYDRNQGNVRAAQAEAARAAAGVQRLELDLRDRPATAVRQYQSSSDTARQYRDERVPAARELFDLRLEALKAGRGDWSKVQQALRAYAQARHKYLQSLLDLRRAEVAIGGFLLVDGLDDPPAPPSQGQPLRGQEQKRLEDALQQPVVGQGGRTLEDRLGNSQPQTFGGQQSR